MKNNWQIKKLGEIIKLEYGKPLDRSERISDGSYAIYGANGEKGRTNKFYYDKPTIIIGRKGSAGELNLTEERFWPLDVTYYLTYDDKKYDLKFLYNLLLTLNLPSLAKGVKPGINRNVVYSIQVKVPPLEVQKKIVKILDEVFENIEKAKKNVEKNLQNSSELFESYLQNIFFKKHKNWEYKKLGDVCELINRGISPRYINSNGLCVLNQKCIREHKINYDFSRLHNLKNKKINDDKLIRVGDVLVNSTGTGTLGRVAQVRSLNFKATVDSHITIVRPKEGLFFNDFFGYALIAIEKDISEKGKGASGQTELPRRVLKEDFNISYSHSLVEQQEFVKKLDVFSELTKKLEQNYKQQLLDLEELKKSVLNKAFSGEL